MHEKSTVNNVIVSNYQRRTKKEQNTNFSNRSDTPRSPKGLFTPQVSDFAYCQPKRAD